LVLGSALGAQVDDVVDLRSSIACEAAALCLPAIDFGLLVGGMLDGAMTSASCAPAIASSTPRA
jgi:hypothetical protein